MHKHNRIEAVKLYSANKPIQHVMCKPKVTPSTVSSILNTLRLWRLKVYIIRLKTVYFRLKVLLKIWRNVFGGLTLTLQNSGDSFVV